MDLSVWLGSGAAIAAVVVSVVGLVRAELNGKATGRLQERVVEAEEQAGRAQRDATTALARSADSQAQLNREIAELRGVLAPPPRVAWSLEHHSGEAYTLTNVGTAEARFVTIDIGNRVGRDGERERDVMRPRDSLTFLASGHINSTTDVTVSWGNENGSNDEWTRILPPKF